MTSFHGGGSSAGGRCLPSPAHGAAHRGRCGHPLAGRSGPASRAAGL